MSALLRSVLENQMATLRNDLRVNLTLALENAGPEGDFYVAYDSTVMARNCLKAIDDLAKQLHALKELEGDLLDAAEAMCPGA